MRFPEYKSKVVPKKQYARSGGTVFGADRYRRDRRLANLLHKVNRPISAQTSQIAVRIHCAATQQKTQVL